MSGERDTKEAVAAIGFGAFLMMAFGPIGMVIAALAVGIESAWNGRAARPASQWADRVDYHTAWLGQDRRARGAARKARRDWLAAGADPATEPKRAPRAKRFAGWLHRALSRFTVGSDRTRNGWRRFKEGCKRGWVNAKRVHDAGGTPLDVWRGRHGSVVEPEGDTPEAGTNQPSPADTAPAVSSPIIDDPYDDDRPVVDTVDLPRPGGSRSAPDQLPETASQTEHTAQEAPMTAPAATTTTAGETHLDLIIADLNQIAVDLARANELNDMLAQVATAIRASVQAAFERAGANGAPANMVQALDAARVAADQISRQVGHVADLTTSAQESVGAAVIGARPAQDAQDALHAAGARGEVVSTAASD